MALYLTCDDNMINVIIPSIPTTVAWITTIPTPRYYYQTRITGTTTTQLAFNIPSFGTQPSPENDNNKEKKGSMNSIDIYN